MGLYYVWYLDFIFLNNLFWLYFIKSVVYRLEERGKDWFVFIESVRNIILDDCENFKFEFRFDLEFYF